MLILEPIQFWVADSKKPIFENYTKEISLSQDPKIVLVIKGRVNCLISSASKMADMTVQLLSLVDTVTPVCVNQ